MKRFFLPAICFLAMSGGARAQSVGPATLNSAGGSAIIGANEFEWSVGEMVLVSTFSAGSITVTQGVLQPHEALPTSHHDVYMKERVSVYPNPSSGIVNIAYSPTGQGSLSFRLTDLFGRTVLTKTVAANMPVTSQQIDLSMLASGIYLLEVSTSSETGSGKIIYKIQKQ